MGSVDQWEELNERQRKYMELIYEHDQVQEYNERKRTARTQQSLSADVWRQIDYCDYLHGYSPLKQSLIDAGLVDPGTGSTFEALERRGYILVKYERVMPHPRADVVIYIRLTTKGRRLVRNALDLTAPKKLATGELREWHWRALAKAWVAWHDGEKGISSDEDSGDGFGYISWNTILRLRDYCVKGKDRPLIRDGRLTITPFGMQYYRENWQHYQEMYPDVPAPEPQ